MATLATGKAGHGSVIHILVGSGDHTQVHYDACKYLTASDLWEGASFPPVYTFTVMGHEAPRYCYDGTFIRGFKAESAMAALELARSGADGLRYKRGKVVTYRDSVDYVVIYPVPRPFGEDGVPF